MSGRQDQRRQSGNGPEEQKRERPGQDPARPKLSQGARGKSPDDPRPPHDEDTLGKERNPREPEL
ncbi:hypothetical protein J7E99_18695 [Streptomyces sp. ISL-44]|uniref:hypothetical protein n=1 Tax=Streptomyces sp. ISL-44 TaxID=2819184 RepID=UPI001BEC01F3|nr:hypothetical protein [Streptomyces sp. ISL-44]MBT2542689.1 hypothetical protein [Streptomyces sp. ISL-44]